MSRTENHANRAYQYLRERFVAGDFQPGTRLLYGPIGKQIGVSATPVREAAGRLANEGLVDLIPNKGAVVRKLDKDSLREIYEVRGLIEPAAAALATQRATEAMLDEIAEQLDIMQRLAGDPPGDPLSPDAIAASGAFDRADYAFHVLITEATGNSALVRTSLQSHVLTRVFGLRPHRNDAASMARTVADHGAILRAMRSGDVKAARRAAAAHIQNGLAVSLREFDEAKPEP